MTEQIWYVYMIATQRGNLYTGITTDLTRRFLEHESGSGAKYFRGDTPLGIIHFEEFENRSEASKREFEIKSLTRKEKDKLVKYVGVKNDSKTK